MEDKRNPLKQMREILIEAGIDPEKLKTPEGIRSQAEAYKGDFKEHMGKENEDRFVMTIYKLLMQHDKEQDKRGEPVDRNITEKDYKDHPTEVPEKPKDDKTKILYDRKQQEKHSGEGISEIKMDKSGQPEKIPGETPEQKKARIKALMDEWTKTGG